MELSYPPLPRSLRKSATRTVVTAFPSPEPTPRVNNLLDLLLYELACLGTGLKLIESEIGQLSASANMRDVRPMFSLMARLNRLQIRELKRIVDQKGITLPSGDVPASIGLWREARRRRDHAEHDCVASAGVLNVLRRVCRVMEATCESGAEAAGLVGWRELAQTLTSWMQDWHLLELQFRKESLRVTVDAYVADANPDRPRINATIGTPA